jgi:predicted ATPase/class 3 adenylate cyclase
VVLREAEALWRGAPFEDLRGWEPAESEAARLVELHRTAAEDLMDAQLAGGHHAGCVAQLEAMAAAEPFRERRWALLMVALYRCGRQADALRAFQRARAALATDLGLDPGPELQALERSILDHDPALDDWIDAGPAPVATASGWHTRTFLSTGIVGSMALWERDPDGMSRVVARHDEIIADAAAAWGGDLLRTRGEDDSTLSVFGRPAAAVAAAAALQQAIAAEAWPSPLPLRVRVGVHTGDAECRDGDWHGPAVNRAAQLRALAAGGQTFLSGVTAGLVADRPPKGLGLLHRGRRALPGSDRPEETWELVDAEDPELLRRDAARVGDLPVSWTSFVGRESDRRAVAELITQARLVTLTGPAGSGKTRLALEVAADLRRRGHTVWMAALASSSEDRQALEAVGTALRFPPRAWSDMLAPLLDDGPEAPAPIEAGIDLADPADDVRARLDLLAGVLVLDNCEHLLDACALVAERLLVAAPGLRILATSRESLGLDAERVWPVAPLALPAGSLRDPQRLTQVESVQLLLDRGRAVRPDLEIGDSDVASVVAICRALDGLPLAIELAAARLRSATFADLAEHLRHQLTALGRRGPNGRQPMPHRTLRLALDASYDLLTPQQQVLVRRLSVFAGGFRLDALETVCGPDLDVLDAVDELVAKSLVTFDGRSARYRLLEPLRQYFAERLDADDDADTVHAAHARWMLSLCEQLGPRLLEDQRSRGRRLGEEAANIETALQWADIHDPDMVLRFVGSLSHYWFFYDQAQGRRWCDAVAAADARTATEPWANALLCAGMLAQNDLAWDRAVAFLREALRIHRRNNAGYGQTQALFWLGRALACRWENPPPAHRAAEATRCFEECLNLCTQTGAWLGIGWSRVWLSTLAYWDGDLDRAAWHADQVVQECGAAGVRHPVGEALWNLGFIARRQGRDDAVEILHRAVDLYRDLNDPRQLAILLVDVAAQEAARGRGDAALAALAESVQLDNRIGQLPGRSFRLAIAALAYHVLGHKTLSLSALGAYYAHPAGASSWGRADGFGGYLGWLTDIEALQAQHDPAAVAAATAAAGGKKLDDLIHDLIIAPVTAPA